MVKIAFWTPQIDVRGTCNALRNYAHYNETLLNNKSIIITPTVNLHLCDEIAIKDFQNRFEVYFYNNDEEFENMIKDCDILYQIKYGKNDTYLSKKIKNVIHCVFDMSDPHGDIYAGVSDTLALKFGSNIVVPHIVGLESSITKENFRKEMNISEHALVFGYHGGYNSFNISFVRELVSELVRENKNIYFFFIGIPIFDSHPQIIFSDKIMDLDIKNKFICTCDAMLHAQSLGESFGLSCAEFSINNKPVITYATPSWNYNHIKLLGNKGIYYKNKDELKNLLINFDKNLYKDIDLNCYKEYLPEIVMKKFKKVFIDLKNK